MKDEVTPLIADMEKYIRADQVRACHSVAYHMMKVYQDAISTGGAKGIRIAPRKQLDARGLNRLKRKFKPSKYRGNSRKFMDYMTRGPKRFGPGSLNKNKNLLRAIKYMKIKGGAVVGWASKKSPVWAAAVQSARRGEGPGRFMFKRSQPLNEAQRKLFGAIGLAPKNNRPFTQPKADFFKPLTKKSKRFIREKFKEGLERALKRREEKAKERAMQRATA